MKNIIPKIMIILIAVTIPVSLLLVGFLTPTQFDETYFGELKYMYDRLYETEGKKIVFIGNSALAFGLRTDFIKDELPDYKIVNFGLYGAIGTKAMLDLSKDAISEGDIVIVAPERNDQAQSLFFSAENVWLSMDADFSMLFKLSEENIPSMVGNFIPFTAQKFGYFSSGEKPRVSGAYSQAAFNDSEGNEVGYMTYERENNIMAVGYDVNDPVDFAADLSDAFIEYLNEYNRIITKKGAIMYYGFTPVNRSALKEGTDESTIDGYYDALNDKLDFRIIGNPNDYVMDEEWFYDSNFHVNSAGMYVYTDRIVDDIKGELSIATPNSIEIPEKPSPSPKEITDGDNSDAEFFTYEEIEGGVKIVGITDAGRNKSNLVIPAVFEGKQVITFDASVFNGNTSLTKITLQKGVRFLADGSFSGCVNLRQIVLEHDIPSALGVGTGLLDGTANCLIYVKRSALDLFSNDYAWGAYRSRLTAY